MEAARAVAYGTIRSRLMDLNQLIAEWEKRKDKESRLLANVARRSKSVPLQEVYEKLAKAHPNSNFATAPNLYLPQNGQVYKHPYRLNATGIVPRKPGNTALIGETNLTDETVPHEMAHVQQNNTKRYNPIEGMRLLDPRRERYMEEQGNINWNAAVAKRADIQSKKYQGYLPDNFDDSPRELAATLQSLEAISPSGTNIMDTQLGKDIFNKPMGRRMYENMMYPERNKMYQSEKNLPAPAGYDDTSWLNTLRRFMRQYTSY